MVVQNIPLGTYDIVRDTDIYESGNVHSMTARRIAVVGGGAAGIFAAVAAAENQPDARVTVFEASGEPLEKVRISGGGRCNVTHHCFDPAALVANYPRGGRELRGPFSRFQPRDTVTWFERRGVALKAEADGRMFPVTDSSKTITDCLLNSAMRAGVDLRLRGRVGSVAVDPTNGRFIISLHDQSDESANRVLIATGSGPQGYRFARELGHTIVPCVPSLFTFKIDDRRIAGLAGISFAQVDTELQAGEHTLRQSGPLLITHWGMSGPAILRLSAWGARLLHDHRYRARLRVNFLPGRSPFEVNQSLAECRNEHGKRRVQTHNPFGVPRRYWQTLVAHTGTPDTTTFGELNRPAMDRLIEELTRAEFEVRGKGIFKEEFVTCGGVDLREIDFRTMQSRLVPGLYFAGEILDIDGVTGGFNFQSAWTTGWIAGEAMVRT